MAIFVDVCSLIQLYFDHMSVLHSSLDIFMYVLDFFYSSQKVNDLMRVPKLLKFLPAFYLAKLSLIFRKDDLPILQINKFIPF